MPLENMAGDFTPHNRLDTTPRFNELCGHETTIGQDSHTIAPGCFWKRHTTRPMDLGLRTPGINSEDFNRLASTVGRYVEMINAGHWTFMQCQAMNGNIAITDGTGTVGKLLGIRPHGYALCRE